MTASWEWTPRLPTLALAGVEPQFFFMWFGHSRAVFNYKFSVLAGLLLFSFFGWGEQALLGLVFFLSLLAFLGRWLLYVQVSGRWGKRKAQGTPHCAAPRVPTPLAGLPSSFHPSESPYVHFLYNVQSFVLQFVGRIEKSTPILSSQR